MGCRSPWMSRWLASPLRGTLDSQISFCHPRGELPSRQIPGKHEAQPASVKQESMKFILLSSKPVRKRIKQHLSDLGHIVVDDEPLHPRALLAAAARQQPHGILIANLPPSFEASVLSQFCEQLPDIAVVILASTDSNAAIKSSLELALQNVSEHVAATPIRPYSSDEQRFILHDDRYRAFAQEEKLGASLVTTANAEAETDIFVRQIGCAVRNHQAARRYLAQVIKTDRGLRTEGTYRTVHMSYKVFWLREHVMRWAAVLAHYVEGVETVFLPPPAPPSPTLDYLHYEPPIESLYSASALIDHGFRPGLLPGLRSILSMKFTGQSEELLTADAVILFGWSSLLREIAMAQVQVMDQILDSGSDWYAGKTASRRMHRSLGIFGDFWSLPWLREHPTRMRDLSYLAITEWIQPKPGHALSPFRDFLRAHQAATPAKKRENTGSREKP